MRLGSSRSYRRYDQDKERQDWSHSPQQHDLSTLIGMQLSGFNRLAICIPPILIWNRLDAIAVSQIVRDSLVREIQYITFSDLCEMRSKTFGKREFHGNYRSKTHPLLYASLVNGLLALIPSPYHQIPTGITPSVKLIPPSTVNPHPYPSANTSGPTPSGKNVPTRHLVTITPVIADAEYMPNASTT